MADIDFDKKSVDLRNGNLVYTYGVKGGPFTVMHIQPLEEAPVDVVTLRDKNGCTIEASGRRWDRAFALADLKVGEFLGYEQDKIENGKKLLVGS